MIIPGVLASSQKGGTVPPPVAGYSLWLDGKDPAAFSFSSSNVVSAWKDKSGNLYDFSQGTVANQPTRGIDGLVSFDGSNDRLVSGTKFMDNMHNGGSNTLFLVYNMAANTGAIMDDGAYSSSTIGFALWNFTATDFSVFVTKGASGFSAVSARNNSRQANGVTGLATVRLDANTAAAADRAFFYLNTGTASQTNALTNAPSTSTASDLISIGSAADNNNFINGSVGEIIWYTSDLSTTNRNLVRDYLITKWGI